MDGANANRPVILAIDDDPVILNAVLSILKDRYDVRPVSSGRSALGYLSKFSANLILIDYQMPEMNGFDVLERLKSDPHTRDIPVIFLTGEEGGDTEVRALEQGAVDFILKPIKPRVLLMRLQHQLELQQYRENMEAIVEEKTQSLMSAYKKLEMREELTLDILASATEMRDPHTGNHINRTTEYVRIIVGHILQNPTERYTLTPSEADSIVKSSKLHDLGKIAVPDHILLKLGKLTPEEFEIMKQHPGNGVKLLSGFVDRLVDDDHFLELAKDIAYGHHEKWNGTGYPQGLKGADIPLAARIAALADVYDALTSWRPYKEPFSHADASAIIVEDSGVHFDPYIVSIFEAHEAEFAAIVAE